MTFSYPANSNFQASTLADSTRGRRDSFRALSAPVAHHGDHQKSTDRSHHGSPPLPVCLVLYIAILAVFCGFLVSGCHKAYVYSGCLLGINGCNSLNGYKYEKMGYILIKALPEALPRCIG
eukprot:s3920_g2.t1